MTNSEVFLDFVGKHYDDIKYRCKQVCLRNNRIYSDDTFHDTILKIDSVIKRKGGLKDMSEMGIKNYFVRSYVNALIDTSRNSYNKKRAQDVDPISFEWKDDEIAVLRDKVIKDFFEDFSVLYILMSVEEKFTSEEFYLFKLKMMCGMTYKQIYDKTRIKYSRDKIVGVTRWVRETLSRQEIKRVFDNIYGELIMN